MLTLLNIFDILVLPILQNLNRCGVDKQSDVATMFKGLENLPFYSPKTHPIYINIMKEQNLITSNGDIFQLTVPGYISLQTRLSELEFKNSAKYQYQCPIPIVISH